MQFDHKNKHNIFPALFSENWLIFDTCTLIILLYTDRELYLDGNSIATRPITELIKVKNRYDVIQYKS